MESVNLKKLAKLLDLSISTVSKALRDSYDISQETKDRVNALAIELNYQPNPHASSLRRHSSKTIALIIPEVANNYFALVINGIESIAQEKDYHVMIYLTHEDATREKAFARTLLSGRVDGALISVAAGSIEFSHFTNLKESGFPIVFFDRVVEDFDTVKVTTDDQESAYLATRHLIEQGCRQVAYLGISNNLSIGNKRLKGYRQALTDYGLPQNDKLVVECTNDQEQDSALIKELLQRYKADGLFASVERYAITSYEICRQLNLQIPGDVKVISFSNMQTASLLNPSLSTITQPAYDIGKEAASVLLKSLQKKNFQLKNENIIVPSSLIQRESTA